MILPDNGSGLILKNNRSSRYTTGLVCTFADNSNRCFFFELDKEHREFYQDVDDLEPKDSLMFTITFVPFTSVKTPSFKQ